MFNRAVRYRALLLLGIVAALGTLAGGMAQSAPESTKETVLETVLRVLGISVHSQVKGPGDEVRAGDVWLATITAQPSRQRLTFDSGYRSPVFLPGDMTILALKGDWLVRIPAAGGESEDLFPAKGVMKLVGVGQEDSAHAVVLTENADGRVRPARLSLQSGQVTDLPYDPNSESDRRALNTMKAWNRQYSETTLRMQTTTKAGLGGTRAWSDVSYLKPGEGAMNVSQCDRVNCGQPSLSHDGTRVLYIKSQSQ